MGRQPGWVYQIRPFADRPDVLISWILYSVPWTNPAGPETVFTDRFWDRMENWTPEGVGTIPELVRRYAGQLPGPEVGPLVGTPEEWMTGLSYDRWIAGGYTDPIGCWQLANIVKPAYVSQAHGAWASAPIPSVVGQVQNVSGTPYVWIPPGVIEQVQKIEANPAVVAVVAQAQEVGTGLGAIAKVQQAQGVGASLTASRPAEVRQAQDVPFSTGEVIEVTVSQAQLVQLVQLPSIVTEVRQAQDVGSDLGAIAKVQQAQAVSAVTTQRRTADVRQAQRASGTPTWLHLYTIDQAQQSIGLTNFHDLGIVRQAQAVEGEHGIEAIITQAQDCIGLAAIVAEVAQAHDVNGSAGYPAEVSQAHSVIGSAGYTAEVSQAHSVIGAIEVPIGAIFSCFEGAFAGFLEAGTTDGIEVGMFGFGFGIAPGAVVNFVDATTVGFDLAITGDFTAVEWTFSF